MLSPFGEGYTAWPAVTALGKHCAAATRSRHLEARPERFLYSGVLCLTWIFFRAPESSTARVTILGRIGSLPSPPTTHPCLPRLMLAPLGITSQEMFRPAQ